jgi:predicted transcriptional regulator
MKTLSLKLDDHIFEETESLTLQMKKARNRYINEALSLYNLFNKRRLLKKQLIKESKATKADSLEILSEFEKLIDEDQAI